jgi:hypothetical protein
MSTTTYEDDLTDSKSQAQQDLLCALDAACERLRESTELQSTVGIREAAEAIIAVDNALKRFGR